MPKEITCYTWCAAPPARRRERHAQLHPFFDTAHAARARRPTGGWVLGNRFQAEAAIKEKLGADTIVNHKVAIFFTVVSEVDGKMGKRECCNRYIFFNCGYCGCTPCKDTTATAENAAEVAGGAPGTAVMER